MRNTLILLLAILIVSCEKEEKPNYPDEPHITITNINYEQTVNALDYDIIKIGLDLKIIDGDSNFGMTDVASLGIDSANCNIVIYHKENDEFIEIFNFLYIIKDCEYLGCDGQDFPLSVKSYTPYNTNGTLYLVFYPRFWTYINEPLKFTVQIWDRDKNMSNVAEFETVCTFE